MSATTTATRFRRSAPISAAALLWGVSALVCFPGSAAADDPADTADSRSDDEARERLLAQADVDRDDDGEASEEGDASQSEAGSTSAGGKLQRSDRMEFDARLIRGERASGAVFLFQRTPRKLPSMVERRRTYLGESVRRVLGTSWAETFDEEREEAMQSGETSSDDEGEASEDEEGENRSIIQEFSAEQD